MTALGRRPVSSHDRDAAYELLVAKITERAERLEADAREADVAANSYKGVDNDAAVDLFRAASRSRSRARELRSLLEADRG